MPGDPVDPQVRESDSEGSEQRSLLHSISEVADEAPTVEEALRAALARICSHTGWEAGRLQFAEDAGDLAGRTFWHLESPERLTSYRSLAEARRRDGGLAAQVLQHGNPLWGKLAVNDELGPGARATFAFPVLVRQRIFAVLEFFSGKSEKPRDSLLEIIGFVCSELGRILQRKPAHEALRRSEREYRALFENAHDGIVILDPEDQAVLDANQRAGDIFGITRSSLIGMSLGNLFTDQTPMERSLAGRESHRALLAGVIEGTGKRFETRHVRRDGSEIILEITAGPVEFRGRRAVWMSNRDVTEKNRVLEALRASEERYRLLFESSPQPMWVFDQESLRFLAVNEAAVRRYGYEREDFERMTIADIRPTEEVAASEGGIPMPPAADGSAPSLWRHRKANGSIIDVEVTSHEIDFAGRKARLVVANDVTERLRAEEKLWHAAFYDALTNLPNRALFMERLGQAQERARGRGGAGYGVLFLDLDRFKFVNDSLGHRAGDQLLVQIAHRLTRIRRTGDTVARLGGDEFSILVEGVHNAEDAGRVAERVQRELALPFDMDGQEVFMSASIGIALGGSGGFIEERPEDLLRDADTAMYRAKSQGSGTHVVFDITMHDRAVAVLQLENDLRRAIDREELRVLYQPVVSLHTGRIVGFEALARWMHRLRGLLLPAEFIPMAEETGLINHLDRWVLAEACTRMRVLQSLHPRSPPLCLSVNLSGRELLQPDLVEQVERILRLTGIEPRTLRLEITETVLVDNASQAARCLTRLRQLGVLICIDDFGTGYSSLSYLHRMPIDLLKIDASFIQTMGSDEKNRRIVETIVLLGRNLGVEVVAEGVETQAQAATLQRLGCNLVQGFLYSRPIDRDEASTLLAAEPPEAIAPVFPKVTA